MAPRRSLALLDQYDIPLLTAEGTLHIIELKGPKIPDLIRRHRNHWIVGDGREGGVHEAVNQAMNYLGNLDDQGSGLTTIFRNDLGLDFDLKRVFVTVVIGCHKHVKQPQGAPKVTPKAIEQAIRSYNAHLSRVEVVTFDTLLDTAEQALRFEDANLTGELPDPGIVTLADGPTSITLLDEVDSPGSRP